MEHISQLGTQIRENISNPDILVISQVFQPQNTVIGEYVYNRCLQDPERVIVLTSCSRGDKVFDQSQEFPVYRCLHLSWGGNFLINNLFNHIFSLLLAIKLYFRYRYSYIEWCHGDNFLVILLLSYILPIRFFIYLHGSDLAVISRIPIWRYLFKMTLKRAEGIVCQSSYIRDNLRKTFRLDTPTHIINPVVRPEKFATSTSLSHLDKLRISLRQNYNIPDTSIIILSVGKLVKDHGFDKVIDNIPLLLTVGIDIHYLICGEGSELQQLKLQAERLRVDKRVHFAGDVSDQKLVIYYAACDIFALLTLEAETKSIDDLETFYLDAKYFGKPIIASRLGSILDAVHHQENGLLVNPESGYETLQTFKLLCQDQQLREKLGRHGKELAKRKTYHRWLYNPETRYACILN